MVDETTSQNIEVCTFCISFIDGNNNVKEVLVDFIRLIRITEEATVAAKKQTLDDRCSSVSCDDVGVQAIIKTIPQRSFICIVQDVV